ncbi:hypothetical protein GTW69_03155 [Streptomyces sp. SID7760]|nr:hypothetical protein [Streptomyces sp. SID7760]
MADFKPHGGVRVSRGDLWRVAIGVLVLALALWLIGFRQGLVVVVWR